MKWVYWLLGGLVIVALVFGGVTMAMKNVVDQNVNEASNVQNVEVTGELETKAYRDSEGTLHLDEALKEKIATTHSKMNSLVGWGRLELFNKSSHWNEKKEEIDDVYESFKEMTERAEGDLHQDFQNGVALMEQATEKEDVEALQYVHRVIQDLDVVVNDYDQKLFNVTNITDNDEKLKSVLN